MRRLSSCCFSTARARTRCNPRSTRCCAACALPSSAESTCASCRSGVRPAAQRARPRDRTCAACQCSNALAFAWQCQWRWRSRSSGAAPARVRATQGRRACRATAVEQTGHSTHVSTRRYPHEYSVSTRRKPRQVRAVRALHGRLCARRRRGALRGCARRGLPGRSASPAECSRRLRHTSGTAAPPRPRGTLKCAGERVRGARSDGREHRVHT